MTAESPNQFWPKTQDTMKPRVSGKFKGEETFSFEILGTPDWGPTQTFFFKTYGSAF